VTATTGGAPFAPFLDPRTAHPPGISPMDPADWLIVHSDYRAQMAEHERLLAETRATVIAELPEAAAMVAEFRAALLAHLAKRPEWRIEGATCQRPDGARVTLAGETFDLAGRLCAEDFLLMAPGEPEYRLVAGSLFFPSRWTLTEKLGRPMTGIHAPVPDYPERLAARLNRMFATMRVEQPLMRVNWGVQPTPRLHLPQREGEKRPADDSGGGFWLRTERQSLVRLPATRALVFAIKTSVTPLAELTPAQRAGLRAAVAAYDEGEVRFRGGPAAQAAVLAALDG
jgi:hypothetical protein